MLFKKKNTKSEIDPDALYDVGKVDTTLVLTDGEIVKISDHGWASVRFSSGSQIHVERMTSEKVLEKRSKHGFFNLGSSRWVPLCRIKDTRFTYGEYRTKTITESMNDSLAKLGEAADRWVEKKEKKEDE